MALEKNPAFQFYPKDFLSDGKQAAMSLAECGAYIRLLCVCWVEGSLPQDVPRLARLCGTTVGVMQKLWPAIALCFRDNDAGRLIHPRLDRERDKQEDFRQLQSQKGKASAKARASNRGSIPVDVRLQPESNSPISDLRSPEDLQPLRSEDLPVRAREPSPSEAPELSERASRFIERYAALFARFRSGAKYHNRPHLDHAEAMGLVAIWDDTRLDELAEAFLTTNDVFCRNGSGTIAQFRSRASWCDAKLREKGL